MAHSLESEQAIFQAARSIPPGDARQEYLQAACGSDDALRHRVRTLLAAHEQSDQFLESPLHSLRPALHSDLPPAERPGAFIGPYKLLEIVGEGGMGIVYRAQQTEPVERQVALKIIKPGMDTQRVLARFESERQALALMDHPNIAKVLDAGTTGQTGTRDSEFGSRDEHDERIPSAPSPQSLAPTAARPYFVMEFVAGQPISKYCDDHQLDIRQRLELMIPVCQAIQHAHQKGIIHRDIKPSNILVAEYDGHAVPKVIDFGVSKAIAAPLTEQTAFTLHGQIIGTLEYMSPEQAGTSQHDIDTRSDVYSLGVLLYELLTGTTPFDKHTLQAAAFHEVLRIIREDDPPRPSARLSRVGSAYQSPTSRQIPSAAAPNRTPNPEPSAPSSPSLASIAAVRCTEPARLAKTIRGDLDWIVMKALEKDRDRRYQTAYALACDLERYLSEEPVQACPPSALYRFGKFARRNKAVLTAAALVLLVLLIGTVVSTWQAIRATRAEALAKAHAARAEVNERQARLEAQRAIAAANAEKAALEIQSIERQRADEQARQAQEQTSLAEEQRQLVEKLQQSFPLLAAQYSELISSVRPESRPLVLKDLNRVAERRLLKNTAAIKTPQDARTALLKLFDGYVAEQGNSMEARQLAANRLAEMKEFQHARELLETARPTAIGDYGEDNMLLLIAADQRDVAAHRRHCGELIARLDGATVGPKNNWLSSALLACALLPNSLDSYDSAIAPARQLLAPSPKSGRRAAALGALLLRAGKNEEAIENLKLATTTQTDVEGANLYGHYLLAMAYHHLDRTKDARAELAKGNAYGSPYYNWRFNVIAKLLRREATQLIDPTAVKQPSQTK